MGLEGRGANRAEGLGVGLQAGDSEGLGALGQQVRFPGFGGEDT